MEMICCSVSWLAMLFLTLGACCVYQGGSVAAGVRPLVCGRSEWREGGCVSECVAAVEDQAG